MSLMGSKSKNNSLEHDLANRIGDFIKYWGFSKIDGQIWTYVFIVNKPLSTPEIIERVGMSKASVSNSIQKLLDFNVIQKGPQLNAGIQTFESNSDLVEVIFSVLRNRELQLMSKSADACELLKRSLERGKQPSHISVNKVNDLQNMIKDATMSLKFILSLDKETLKDWIEFMQTFKD